MTSTTGSVCEAFFIVGAPRTGTTAMSRYLRTHPGICFADPKETHYFVFADPNATPAALRQRFVNAFFPDYAEKPRMLGEGSVTTMYSDTAIRTILTVFPTARFIAMFRDPVELLQSYHARLLHLRQENVEEFETAWNLQQARADGRHIPKGCRDARLLQYREVGRLGHYSRELLALAGRERCHGIFFDDLAADPLPVYKAVLAFLDLPYDGRVLFGKKNEGRTYRNRWLQDLYTGPILRPVAARLMRDPVRLAALQRATRPLRKRIKRINSAGITLPPLDPRFAASLRQEFRSDIELLGRTFNRDLQHWL